MPTVYNITSGSESSGSETRSETMAITDGDFEVITPILLPGIARQEIATLLGLPTYNNI